MENYEEEDACGSELIPDSPRPPIFVDFSAKPTPSESNQIARHQIETL